MAYVTVEVEVDVELSDIPLDELISEIEDRGLQAAESCSCNPERNAQIINDMRLAIYSGNEKRICELAREFFWENHNIMSAELIA